ncbi:MAG: PQQ-binding-like beta-propeller repeat protein [Planctomycetaceae bacterium]|nr:PQQ-binding-like beta-propeller repeat protein [Planctomycetaceae bacterium]MCB9953313.1 PQQ-binding-like beta-propeller repeat protein [Planctomycetaceae bacterium]
MKINLLRYSLLLSVLLMFACKGKAQDVPAQAGAFDWPQFLGPDGTGISAETDLLDVWPQEGPPLVWEKTVGTGYSAPSVRNGMLVLHHRVKDEEIVECFDAQTGEAVWKHSYESTFTDPYGYNNGPRCSPLLTNEFCITLGAQGKLLCLKLTDGSVVWQLDLLTKYRVPEGFFGVGCTPILEGEKLIVLVGGQPNSGVVAFNFRTGKVIWENVGKRTWDGAQTGWDNEPEHEWDDEQMVVSYSSPIVATIHDKRHVLCLVRHGLVSLDPESGKENFHFWFRARVHESVNAARPVVVDDTIMLSAAYRVGSALLKVKPDGNSYDVLWQDPRNLLTHWSTAIYLDGCYFGFSGRHENEGELRCIDAKTGEIKWQTDGWMKSIDGLGQLPDGSVVNRETKEVMPWPFYGRGSAIVADGKFIVLAERGTLALVEATTEEWKEISRCKAPRMHYPSWPAPVLANGRLYLRCEDALICLDLRKTK